MKFWSLIAIVGLLSISCASQSEKHAERDVASTKVPECVIEKHNNKDWYRVSLYGKPYNNYWYSSKKVHDLKNEIAAAGQCQ